MSEYQPKYVAPPCHRCGNEKVCEDGGVACERFAYYTETGIINVKFKTKPHHRHYVRCYHGDAE